MKLFASFRGLSAYAILLASLQIMCSCAHRGTDLVEQSFIYDQNKMSKYSVIKLENGQKAFVSKGLNAKITTNDIKDLFNNSHSTFKLVKRDNKGHYLLTNINQKSPSEEYVILFQNNKNLVQSTLNRNVNSTLLNSEGFMTVFELKQRKFKVAH